MCLGFIFFVFVDFFLSPSCFFFSSVQPNTSFPIYWKSGDLPFAFYFRPGSTEGYAWSGPVIASEEFAGQNWISLYNGISTAPPGKSNTTGMSQLGVSMFLVFFFFFRLLEVFGYRFTRFFSDDHDGDRSNSCIGNVRRRERGEHGRDVLSTLKMWKFVVTHCRCCLL